MNYFWVFLKFVGYAILAFFLFVQIIAFGASTNTQEFLIRGSILLVVGLYLAIKWQRRNKLSDESHDE